MTMTMNKLSFFNLQEVITGENSFHLTNREREILNLIASGYLNKQIAKLMNITEQTAKNHITNIFKKLEATNRTEAVIKAIRLGIIRVSALGN